MFSHFNLEPANPRIGARLATALGLTICVGMTTLLTGCAGMATSAGAGSSTGSTSNPPSTGGGSSAKVTGRVYGGQQPIVGASVQLYAVGTSGLQSASTALLSSPVTTAADGSFSITGAYSCTGATDVYLVATGGNSGSGSANGAITQVAALGPCATLQANAATTFIQMNELTTVAAAYALAPFASDYQHVGAAGAFTTGMTVAFQNAALLVDTGAGTAGGANLATGVTVPVNELNTLGNIIASCINTSGSSSGQCASLFSATSASETFGAALAIAKNSGATAVTNLYTLPGADAPFQPSLTLSAAPNDFTVAVKMAGSSGTLSTPYGLAIDASGNAWVTNETGTTIAAFSPVGSATTATATGLIGAQGIAIDQNKNVWVANTAGNSVVELTPPSGFVPGSGTVSVAGNFTAGGITGPTALAVDAANNVWVANFNGNSVTGLASSGAPMSNSPFTGSGNITVPTGIAVGQTGNVYVTSGNGSIISGAVVNSAVVTLSSSGTLLSTLDQGSLQGPVALAVDPVTDNTFLTGFTTGASVQGALSEFPGGAATGAISPGMSGVSAPAGIAFDGTSIWVANSTSTGGVAKFAYGAGASGSPSNGFGAVNTPVGIAVDPSGSVWTTNAGDNTVTKFIGLAAPVTTPTVANLSSGVFALAHPAH